MMIKSMTGFGRSEVVTEECKITVEIKAVNHRYCDLNLKIPKKFNSLDTAIRNHIKKSVNRGKLDVYILYEDPGGRGVCVSVNESLAKKYYDALKSLSTLLDIPNDAGAVSVARMPEVLIVEEDSGSAEAMEQTVFQALDEALAAFEDSRMKEGEHLKDDILGKLAGMADRIDAVEVRYPEMVEDYRSKIEEKVRALLEDAELDENRLAAEVILYADKICVDEETVRLRSHVKSMEEELTRGGSVGRKLDFIAQEMNREANTILSKANDVEVSGIAVDLKTDIEKIREQVQNIE